MQNLTLGEIISRDIPALTAIIEYNHDFSIGTVFMAYNELNRRNYVLSEKLLKKLKECASEHGIDDIYRYAIDVVKEKGFSSYIEYYNTAVSQKSKNKQENAGSNQESNNKYPALNAVSGLYKVLGIIIAIIGTIGGAMSFMGSTTIGMSIVIASIVIGLLLYASGELFKVFIDIEYNTRQWKNK